MKPWCGKASNRTRNHYNRENKNYRAGREKIEQNQNKKPTNGNGCRYKKNTTKAISALLLRCSLRLIPGKQTSSAAGTATVFYKKKFLCSVQAFPAFVSFNLLSRPSVYFGWVGRATEIERNSKTVIGEEVCRQDGVNEISQQAR